MPTIEARRNKEGIVTSYRITVSEGYRSDGSQARRRFLWSPPYYGMSERDMEREATTVAYKFEERVKIGFKADSRLTFEEYAAYVLDLKEQTGVRPTTLERYLGMMPTINEAIGHLQLTSIRPERLNDFYEELKKTKNKKGAKARATRNLMNLLDEKGISNQKLAKAAQISASTVTNAVRGDPICIESAEKIANVLDSEVRDLFRNASTGKTLAPKTVLEYHRLISTILHQAEKEMILMYNPAARATPPKAKAPTPDYYQPDQMDEILNALENAPLLWKTITYIMIDSGCRRGEALGLKWSSLELDTGLMVIENNLQYTKKTGIYLGPTKTGKVRALKLAPQCVELLKEWKLEQMRMRLKQGSDWKETGMVFTKDNGEWLHPDSITRWLNNFSRDNGLPHIHPHAFRHTAASTMIANGVDLVTTANELGHANATTTAMIYAHQIAIAKARAADVRAGVFAGRDSKHKGSKLRSKFRGA